MAVSLVLAMSLILGYSKVVALAATSVKGSIGGISVSGALTMNTTSATASTSFGSGGGTIYATATVYYWFGTMYYKSEVGPNESTAGGASATATKKLGGADVVGAKGQHKVKWQAYTWEPADTTTGTIIENAVERN